MLDQVGDQASQVNLDLLWAEWQTVAQARLLFDQVLSLRAQQQTDPEHQQDALATVSGTIHAALLAGNLTYDGASAGLNAEADVLVGRPIRRSRCIRRRAICTSCWAWHRRRRSIWSARRT
ncbi:hypothetical protein [Rhodanobacter lindaniclasticus]